MYEAESSSQNSNQNQTYIANCKSPVQPIKASYNDVEQ